MLDGRLPDGSGVDVCREIRSKHPEIAALILTSFDDDEALFSAIMAGAAGYVLKQVRGNDLIQTIRRVAAGQSTLDPAVTQQVLDRLRNGPAEDPALAALTPQERRILELIGEGMTNRQIADAMFLAEKTVKNYVSGPAGQARPPAPDSGSGLRHAAPTVLGAVVRPLAVYALAGGVRTGRRQPADPYGDQRPDVECDLRPYCRGNRPMDAYVVSRTEIPFPGGNHEHHAMPSSKTYGCLTRTSSTPSSPRPRRPAQRLHGTSPPLTRG